MEVKLPALLDIHDRQTDQRMTEGVMGDLREPAFQKNHSWHRTDVIGYPDVLHVLPAADHAVLHGVGALQHAAQLARVLTHHQVFHLNTQLMYIKENYDLRQKQTTKNEDF